jgi:iron-sulfur cluster repair protein YtfE (RIC family)
MDTITSVLTEDHRLADKLFAAATEHGARGEWRECEQQLAEFRAALESHMKIEEEVLFPAFEQATGMTSGPTAVMRGEHQQMLKALDAMNAARLAGDTQRFESLARSFMGVLDAHSAKEENILYPMCDRMVGGLSGEQLRERLQQLRTGGTP